jgi:hypothetical protein
VRKPFFLITFTASILIFGMFSPAEAGSSKRYAVSLTPTPSASQTTYNVTSLGLASSGASSKTRTTIRGKVTGGRVKGKKVQIYATHMDTQPRRKAYVGSARINAKGYFRKTFSPSHGRAGTYKIDVVKKRGNGLRAGTKTFYIRVHAQPGTPGAQGGKNHVPGKPIPAPPGPGYPGPATPGPNVGSEPLTDTAGADTVGSTSYTVPSQAVFVSPDGSDTNAGSQPYPVKTLAKAISIAPSGATVVLRAGTYHESVTVPSNKRLTIQNFPGEAAWLDGSSAVTGFQKSGSTWVKSGWTAKFDSSPTYTKGAADGTAVGWQWINPAYPMASHPDQVWIGSTKLAQVGSRSQVTAGTFFVDYDTKQLVLGSDPDSSAVRASDLGIGLTVVGSGTVVRGIGIRRYATSVPDMGTVRIAASGVTLENVVVSDNATQGVTAWAANTTLRKVTAINNGLTGFHAHQADSFVADRVLSKNNNNEHFNVAPVSAGLKISSSRGITVTDSEFRGNDGTGLWFDESDYNVRVTGNTIADNTDDGLIFELSSILYAADNKITGNRSQSVFVIDSDKVKLWNNTITGSQVPIRVSETDRDAATGTYGFDKRQPRPDPTMTWETGQIDIKNNLISDVVKGNNWCGMLCVYDHDKKLTAEQMGVTLNGNFYERSDTAAPSAVIRWASGSRGAVNYNTLSTFRSSTGQETAGVESLRR